MGPIIRSPKPLIEKVLRLCSYGQVGRMDAEAIVTLVAYNAPFHG
nr:hypothetical protein [Antarctobacter sp.]